MTFKSKGYVLAITAAVLINNIAIADTSANNANSPATVKCYGINTCHGRNSCNHCMTYKKSNACKGFHQNKADEIVMVHSAKECTEFGGKVVK